MDDFQDLWDNAEEPQEYAERVADEIPDGTYDARTTDFSVFKAKDGSFYVSWWFKLQGGVLEGSQVQRFSRLTDRSSGYLKKDLKTVTGRVPSRGEVYDKDEGQTGEIRDQIVGSLVRIRQKTRTVGGSSYVDVYINELLTPARREEPVKKPAPPASKAETRPEPPHPAEGWGDPSCGTCKGAGCDNCVAF